MYWQVIIPEAGTDSLSKSITIEADNWFSALRSSLTKQGVDGTIVSNLSCNINPDESVTVSDFVAQRVYQLKPIDKPDEKEQKGHIDDDTCENTPALLEGDFLSHKIFFWRDEAPEDGSGIFYRERLVSVEPGSGREEVGSLVRGYFNELKRQASPDGTKLFISVQVFDHKFDDRAERPAIAALTWREWNPKKPKILFPLSGDESLTFSKLPLTSTHGNKPLKKEPSLPPDSKTKNARVSKPSVEQHTPPPPIFAPRKKTAKKKPVVDDRMVQAFERMQEIYSVRNHDSAADFALSLARELIPCEAGSCMLTTPGKYSLYVAAAQGSVKDTIAKKQFSFHEGIVGFATRGSVVINVTDPENDPRFDSSIDMETGFKTKSILCAPIQIDGLAIGAIELLNSQGPSGFNQNEANVLSYLGGALAEYISTSLPSREADFNEREFLEPFRGKPQVSNAKRATSNPQPGPRSTSAATALTPKTSSSEQTLSSTKEPSPSRQKGSGTKSKRKNRGKRKKKK